MKVKKWKEVLFMANELSNRFSDLMDGSDAFRAGFGTILYFTETQTVHKLEADFPLYAANFVERRCLSSWFTGFVIVNSSFR